MSEERVEAVRQIYQEVVAPPDEVREVYDPDYEMDLTDIGPMSGLSGDSTLRGKPCAHTGTRSRTSMSRSKR